MTKQEATQKVEEKNAKVLSCRMWHGIPKVTVGWRDYPKVRNLREVIEGKMDIAIR